MLVFGEKLVVESLLHNNTGHPWSLAAVGVVLLHVTAVSMLTELSCDIAGMELSIWLVDLLILASKNFRWNSLVQCCLGLLQELIRLVIRIMPEGFE